MLDKFMQVIELLGDIMILMYLKAQLFFYTIVANRLNKR